MAKSSSKNDYNKNFQKKQAQRLSKLKRSSKSDKNKANRKRSSATAQLNQEVASLRNKLGVYENIIGELRAKVLDYESVEQKQPIETLASETPSPTTEDGESAATKPQLDALEIQLRSMEQSVSDWQNKAVRLSADLQNVQKQNELDILQAKKNSKKNTIMSIMAFLNTLNISFNYIPETTDEKVISFIQTLKSSYEQVIGELRLLGIDILVVNPGDQFDPAFMNILNTQVSEEGGEILNEVVQVVGLGLKIDAQLIQAASVIIK